uniref:Cycloeucalenol cycloisomerase n=1 Tax=Chlamydomonas chlamydogama TaxID=225041 RepID=A0A7S2QSM8_9CHLO|mmetsp:Transcript_1246/g.2703  ORF Transcript_1246/g.2703 Transcript_1246/m.2703 type:complete len:276 (+) Transcript_1246:54-881(+)|eukprot:CAMPEP_0202920868 /NCGR_PEP_ID=MMETSP1392-20130828/77076_1 /ASSEMBLY_ACC=CAM_ASM_000868 /TAXON_ID=225041 /ORGANISM="Chlamydomonas chlamydogama, Strain SAG 11-48b" /LENGTH=275 /DNA_ID=CAMNT_0049614387 /DNA_START=52 /DNA_END=879 /DNA_ORIENTATION=-
MGWLASNPAKRWTEVFFLTYSVFWITWALCLLVPLQLYEYCGNYGYLAIGLSAALPCFLLPLFIQPKSEASKPFLQRYWVKANIWIAIFSYVGNYFWTHYFFRLLGASYTFVSWRLNDVPITLYFMTHAYFCFYHALSNVMLRRTSTALAKAPTFVRRFAMGVVVFGLSYATAYGETLTIAHFPYYSFIDKERMYTIGSLFYAIYFFVSFPLFYIMDEDPKVKKWTAWQAAVDSLAASMLVTILLDLWRISYGGIIKEGVGSGASASASSGLPWM